jgi:DNA-binding MarR family transcriptional regulator
LTKEELLFLHLLQNNHLRDNYIVTDLFTQRGIQSVLECDLSLISRLLKKNEEEGYIIKALLKIENKKRKQNAYFLTDEGIEFAMGLSKANLEFQY